MGTRGRVTERACGAWGWELGWDLRVGRRDGKRKRSGDGEVATWVCVNMCLAVYS